MSKKKVLIADDQEDVLLVLKDFLVGHDFEIMIIKEPKNILASIISFKPDLILLDLLMPDLGGFEICEILNKDLQTREIPIIIISGFGDATDIKKAYSLGAVGYLVKPFALGTLFTEITKIITNKESKL